MKKAKYIFGVFLLIGMLGILKAQNAMISGTCKSGLQATNKNENAIASYEYAKVGEEGFRNRDAQEIIEKTSFTDCEPVWWYWSFNNVPGGAFVEGKSEWTFPNGTVNTYDFFDGPAPTTGWAWFRYSNHFDNLGVGTHTWKVYEKSSNGAYVLKSTKLITVTSGSSGLSCAQRMYLPLNGNTQDISGSGNHAIQQGGAATYGPDRFGNCNAALRINGGKYLEAPVINERAVSLWFKLNQQDQMVIYDSGPNEFESKDFKIGVFKPNGLYGSPSFDNSTFGVFFNTWDRDIAVPFDAVKSGWHHIVVSRVSDGFERFRIMIDGQFPSGYMWDGFPTVQQWVAQNQPFTLPAGGYGVPNLFDPSYKTYMGKDFQQTNELFDGWLDEVRVFNQLLDVSEMTSLYNASNTLGLTLTTSSTPACNGSSNGSATVSNVSGGTPPYTYVWSNGQTTSTISNISNGTYIVTVSSSGGCSPTTATVTVISMACAPQNDNCNQAISILPDGQPHTGYTNAGATVQSGEIPPPITNCNTQDGWCGLNSLENTVWFKFMATGCAADISTFGSNFDTQLALWSFCPSSGTLIAANDDYWGSGNGNTSFIDNAPTIVGQTYYIQIDGYSGATGNITLTVTPYLGNISALVSTVATCPNQTNGTATVTATGGTAPYSYLWSNNQTSATATGLATGTYTVTITSSSGCSATATATVGTSPSPSATIASVVNACAGQSNGTATVTATGGTSPYTYHWSNNQNTATATGLAAGTYTVTVTSATGCTTSVTATITNNPPTQAAFSFTLNNNTVSFANASTNATSYLWNFGDGLTSTQASPTHTYASPNNYVICLTSTGLCGSSTFCDTVLLAPPGWNPTPCNTGIVHTIGVESDVITNIAGQQLEPGDLVGFFYTDQSGATLCNNMGAWTGSALVLEVCGDNPATANVKEGYGTGENFIVKVWKGGMEHSVVACFVPEDTYGANNPSATGSFAPFGLSYIDCLKTPSDPGADLGCDSPIPIACGETKTGNNDDGASNANTYSCFSNLVDGPEVVYQFVNTASQNVLITLTGIQSDLELLVLRPCDRNDCIAYSDRTGTSPEAIFLENLAPGTYFIVVEGYLGSSSNYMLSIQCGVAGNGNLNCANATPINCGQSLQGSVVGGTNQVVQWSCSPAYTSGKERVYSFVSNEDKYAFASLTGLTADVDLFILDACNPDNCITSSNKSGTENEAVIFHAPPGKLFYIVVDGYFGAEGSFNLSIPCVEPCQDPADCPYEIGGPGNTQIINAPSLQCGVPVTGNNANGQANASYYSCPGGFTNGKEVVYKFENPVAQDITIVLSGMAANLDLYLLSGPSIFNCHSASHKSGTSDEGIVVQALPSGTYYVVVDGYNGATSGYNLVVNCSNSTLTCQTIDLVQGTNFISSNIVPLDPAIELLFPSSAQSKIISIESQTNLSYSPYAQTDPAVFGDWDFRKAYRIKALEAVSVEVCGEKADPATPIPFVAQTPQGQPVNNWAAYLPEDAVLVGDKFNPTLTPKIYRVWNMPTNASGTLTPQSWSVTLQSGNNYQMSPGRGYIINASEDGDYSLGFWNGGYAEERAKNAASLDFVENGCSYYRVMPYNSLQAATILIPKEAMEILQIGDEVGVCKPDGTLIGSGKFNGFSLSIVVTGDEAATLGFSEGFLEGEQMLFRSWSSEENREFTLKASFDASDDAFHNDKVYLVKAFELDNTLAWHSDMPVVEWTVYPNPVRESAIIDIKLSEPSRVHIQLISPNGALSQTFVEEDMPAGRSVLNVKTSELNTGYYLLRMTTPKGVSFKKIVISKN